ncbi:MAG: PAS domain-containing protein [Betaproteobacteria bacterium]
MILTSILPPLDTHTDTVATLIRGFLLQSHKNCFFVLDEKGRILACMGATQSISGYHEIELVGRYMDCLFTPHDQERVLLRVALYMALSSPAADECWHVRKDGSLFWGSGTYTAIRDEQGMVAGFIKSLRDRNRA